MRPFTKHSVMLLPDMYRWPNELPISPAAYGPRDRVTEVIDDLLLGIVHRSALCVRDDRADRGAVERSGINRRHRACRTSEVVIGAPGAQLIPPRYAPFGYRHIDPQLLGKLGYRLCLFQNAELDLPQVVVAPLMVDTFVVRRRPPKRIHLAPVFIADQERWIARVFLRRRIEVSGEVGACVLRIGLVLVHVTPAGLVE